MIACLFLLMTCLPIESLGTRGRRILTGEEINVGTSVAKVNDEMSIGIGFTDASELRKYFFIQLLAWLLLLGGKGFDWWRAGHDSTKRDIKEMKEMLLNLQSQSRHWMTDRDVSDKVREEFEYLVSIKSNPNI